MTSSPEQVHASYLTEAVHVASPSSVSKSDLANEVMKDLTSFFVPLTLDEAICFHSAITDL